MSSRSRWSLGRALAALLAISGAGVATVAIDGCSSDDAVTGGSTSDAPSGTEAGSDGASRDDATTDSATTLPDAAAFDASCPKAKVAPSTGETCVGFGKGTPCDTACGLPAYGYVCFNGGPPGFAGCVQAGSSSFGETYCCPDDKCVPQPDQDKECKAAGTPHRYQCPPDVAPPSGCEDAGGGGSAVERFYCCK